MAYLDNVDLSDEGSGLGLQLKNCGRVRDRPSDNKVLKEHKAVEEIVNSYYAFTYKQTTGTLLSTRLAAMERSMEVLDSRLLPDVDISKLISSLSQATARNGDKARISIPLDDHIRESDEDILEFLTVPYVDLDPQDTQDHPQIPAYPHSSHYSQLQQLQQQQPQQPQQQGHIHNPHLRHGSRRGFSSQSKVSSRPPPMVRRASSMILSQRELSQSVPVPLPEEFEERKLPDGIPTPLQHAPSKQEITQALFTTTDSYPYAIKTLNDIACIVSGSSLQDALSRGFLDFVCPRMARYITEKLNDPNVANCKTKLSGELVEMNSHLMCLWVEEPHKGVLIWVVEEVPSRRISMIEPPTPMHDVDSTLPCVHRVDHGPDAEQNVMLQGETFRWSPQAIGAAVVLDAQNLTICDYNQPALNAMLGLEHSLVGRRFDEVVPQFTKFWPAIEQFCKVPGVVIPEHKFRSLAGIPFSSPDFTSPNPSRHPVHSIRAVINKSNRHFPLITYIDMQIRVVTPNILVAWIGYSHTSAVTTSNLIPKIFSVMSHSTPHTPHQSPRQSPAQTPLNTPEPTNSFSPVDNDYSRLLEVKVGAKRRELKFKDFKELKLLGRGAYGEVRLVLTPTKDKVVLKSIFKDRILVDTWSRDRALGTIPNEIRILNQLRPLRHPNIAEMIDFFEDPKCYHVEMVPYGGPDAMDLFDFIETRSGTSSPEYLLNIWRQVVSGVAQIHALGITHRDIKDENVVMDNYGVAKLIDFGGSAYVNQGPFDVFVGTIDYAAPEIVKGEQYEGCPQDAWALGILLYIIMFHEPPFKSADEIIQAQLPDEIPCLGSEYIRKLLSGRPEDRPKVSEVLERLQTKF